MKELFEKFKRVGINENDAFNLVLIDTCFFIDTMKHHERIADFSRIKNKAITSFNVLELLHVEHRLGHEKHAIRKFLEDCNNDEFVIINIDVMPGQFEEEKRFVSLTDADLLKHCKDASDAVILACAIKTKSIILTKDKHHLFTVELENFLRKYNVKVFKEMKDVLRD